MPIVKEAKYRPKLRVEVHTRKCSGVLIRCQVCGYTGQADVVEMRSRRNGRRSLERCPECKSMNIVCREVSLMDEDRKTWEVDKWEGCYPSQWKGMIVPEAMAHPAKFSSRLIRRIYEHLFDEGWVKHGDRIVDPFGGVALGALHALEFGLDWVGNELEPKFVELGRQNIEHWNSKFSAMPHWGTARLYQGDSRKLGEVLKAVGGEQEAESGMQSAVSSPPYEESDLNHHKNGLIYDGEAYKRPYMDGRPDHNYRTTEGNLGAMPAGDFQASLSSPPFRHSEGGTPEPKPGGVIDERLYARHAAGNSAADGYGTTDGQLANMKEGDYQGAVSSPPWEDKLSADRVNPGERRDLARAKGISNAEYVTPIDMEAIGGREQKDARYGFTEGQLGADSGDDFWLAARQIVEQVYALLEPGGHACWVVKDFVRNKERVAFSDQWRQLCEAVGFVTLHEHRAMLVHRKGASLNFEGEIVEHKTESKSFFRRIAERKGSPRVDWEVVWCMEKPL